MKKSDFIKKDTLRHFIFVEVPHEKVIEDALLWFNPGWWPKNSKIKFEGIGSRSFSISSVFKKKIDLSFISDWDCEIKSYTEGINIEWSFASKDYKGKERISLEGRMNGTRVDYLMEIEPLGIIQSLKWQKISKSKYEEEMRKIFHALSEHLRLKGLKG